VRFAAVALLAVTLTACGDEPTPFEVIEEVTFATSLGIDLADFTELPSGVWIQEDTVGMGDVVVNPSNLTVTYTGWLANGNQFDTGTFSFAYPGGVIRGFALGMEGMAEGGVRRIIVPPELGYGESGTGPIPGGAVLIFRVRLTVVG